MREAVGFYLVCIGFIFFGFLLVPMGIKEKIYALVVFGTIFAFIVFGIYLMFNGV